MLSRLLQDAVYQWIGVPLELVREAAGTWLEPFPDQRFSLTDAVSFELLA